MLFRTTRKLLVFITKVSKTTINRGWGGCVFSLFREDGSTAQKLANRWNCFCINSFAEVNVALFWSSMTELTEWLVKAHQDKIQSGQPMYRFYWFSLSDRLCRFSVFCQCLFCFVLFCFGGSGGKIVERVGWNDVRNDRENAQLSLKTIAFSRILTGNPGSVIVPQYGSS